MTKDLKIYSYKGEMKTLTPDKIVEIIGGYEKSLRTDKFKYMPDKASFAQAAEIKANWPTPLFELFKQRAKEFAGNQPVTASNIRKAILAVGRHIALERSKISNLTYETELRLAFGEIGIASIFQRAPESAINNIPTSRTYQLGGKLIRVKTAVAPKKLVVNVGELLSKEGEIVANSPEIYVVSLHNDAVESSILLGYALREDVIKQKKGDKTTDPDNCPWKDMAFYMPIESLRPMSEFYSSCHPPLAEIPGGLAFESVPKLSELPIPLKKEVQDMTKGEDVEAFDFEASIGIVKAAPKEQPKAEQPKVAPKMETASAASNDDDLSNL